ncbi:TetR/AcrR family transcriptional regulator [Shimia sediminis]|uniref:TetR/AcrR family transcriptional regulator n=1 Tax=Shimia sediminis TaxID=2497945 RepID=UPI000F8F6267|nr:TetR/AcrR family transcriptional regulator [Shimia sediminis]
MTGKVAKRRADLKQRLIEAAEAQIVRGGMASVKARDLATAAGCSLGAIYNVVDDLQDLILEVNGRTFLKLGQKVEDSVAETDASPRGRLILMSNAYLDFAAENANLWRALFDVRMPADGPVPDWYLSALGKLFANIRAPLGDLFPEMDDQPLELMTRAMFSSVHGIVLLGLENRISGVPQDNIRQMIAQVLSRIGPEEKI